MKNSVKFAISAAIIIFMIAGFCLPALFFDNSKQGTDVQSDPGPAGSQETSTPAVLPDLPEKDAEGTIEICLEKDYKSIVFEVVDVLNELREKEGKVPLKFHAVVLPALDKAEEREEKLTQLRVEIMAGGGPDLFLCNSWKGESLFPVPEKAMEQGLFYPLDRLMEQAEYFTTEQLNTAVLEGGRTADGQMILPLAYTYPLTVMDPALGDPQSWQEQIKLEDEELLGTFFHLLNSEGFSCSLGNLADYREEKLLFTQEELAQQLRDARDLMAYRDSVDYPTDYSLNRFFSKGKGNAKKVPVPICNKESGVTALVSAYAAINRNSEHILGSFALLDLLLSDDIVSARGIFLGQYVEHALTGEPVEVRPCQGVYAFLRGVPVKEGFLKENLSSMSGDSDLKAIEEINGRINAVQFPSNLSTAVQEAFYDMMSLYWKNETLPTDADIDRIAEENYVKVRMVLQE